ncbi:MAG: SDR family NAD(P)-dependent oxidoreductase, partial [Candidatus Acidiferrum sp.]
GGTDGIGKEIARDLARGGASVLIVGRDLAKGQRAQRELRDSTGNLNVEFLPADLSLIRESYRLAKEAGRRCPALHYLVHSAGLVRGHRELTEEGVESNFAINYLRRFALTSCLLPLLESGGRPGSVARILIISGALFRMVKKFKQIDPPASVRDLRTDLRLWELSEQLVEARPFALANENPGRQPQSAGYPQ